MNIHIIGIAGKTTSALAVELAEKGHRISGSDKGVYPPASTYLTKSGIEYAEEYDEKNLPMDADVVVVGGNVVTQTSNPEVIKALDNNMKVVTFPHLLEEFVVKENSIVVVGNYGKGTVSGAIVKSLVDLGKDPSYMVGGMMEDLDKSLVINDSHWSVIEGDEYLTPPLVDSNGVNRLEQRSKFFYYHPKYLVLTSAAWDHFDAFPTEQSYIDNFIELIKGMPSDGLIVANYDGENVAQITKHAPCKVVTYSLVNPNADYTSDDLGFQPNLIGRFNLSNITAAYTLLASLDFDTEQLKNSLDHYKGLKLRMTVMHEHTDLVVVRDLAHSPIKAKSAISACVENWPGFAVVAVLDILASSLKNREALPMLHGALDQASMVYIPRVRLRSNMGRDLVVTGKEIVAAIRETQPNVEYVPKKDVLLKKLLAYPNPKVILLMSTGGMDGLDKDLLKQI